MDMFGREILRDLIAALREEGLIAAGPRSPKLGAPHAYVTTEKFLLQFGFESARELPDIEALKDAGLLSGAAPIREGNAGDSAANAVDGPQPQEVSRVRFALPHGQRRTGSKVRVVGHVSNLASWGS